VDFRKGIDGLAAVCRQALGTDPLGGALFVFCSRRGHAIKCLTYDGQGFWIAQKRLSSGRFTGWPKGQKIEQEKIEGQVPCAGRKAIGAGRINLRVAKANLQLGERARGRG